VATGVTLYGYASHPHHPGAVWWLLGAVAVIAAWALIEAGRWRVKYRRLLAIRQAASAESQTKPISKLLADGKELQANIGNHMAWFGTNRLLPSGAPGRIVRWGSDVCEALTSNPEIRTLFQNAPEIDPNSPISGRGYARVEYQLKVLNSAVSDNTGDFTANSAFQVRADLEDYRSERLKRLGILRQEGIRFRDRLNAIRDPYAKVDDTLVIEVRNWEAPIKNALMYWPDLNRFSILLTGSPYKPLTVRDLSGRIGEEIEALDIAAKRLAESFY
jgi:hypothetical protein